VIEQQEKKRKHKKKHK